MTLASLNSPNFTGADLSARVNAILLEARSGRRFLSPAAVLADRTLGYSTGNRPVAAGDRVVTADGHAYEVALSAVTNHHVATAGGVKLYVLTGPLGYDVLAFGADRTGAADSTAAVQKAIDIVKGLTHGGTVLFPAGAYSVSSLDLGNPLVNDFKPTITLQGAGMRATRILGNTNDKIVVDALGRNFLRLEKLTIGTAPGITAKAGLLLARSADLPAGPGTGSCNNGQFTQLNIEGVFSEAALVAIASESNRWFGCRFENQATTGARRNFWTSGFNGLGITSELGTIDNTPASAVNTDNRMFGCEFYNTRDGCSPVVISRSASYHFFGCTIITGTRAGTVRLVTYDTDGTGEFSGLVEWVSCHFEGGGAGVTAHYFECDGLLAVFHNVHFLGGTYVMAGAKYMVDYDRDGVGKAYLRNCIIQTPTVWGDYEFHAYGLARSDIDLRVTQGGSPGFKVKLLVSDLISESRVVANTIYGPLDLSNCDTESFATAAPTSGTYAVGHIVKNSAPNLGTPSAWYCRIVGTAGTLNGGATTGSITTGTNILTVNSTAGLEEGHIINVAGAGFTFKVLKISGTTVTLSKNASATVLDAAVSFTTPAFAATPALV